VTATDMKCNQQNGHSHAECNVVLPVCRQDVTLAAPAYHLTAQCSHNYYTDVQQLSLVLNSIDCMNKITLHLKWSVLGIKLFMCKR